MRPGRFLAVLLVAVVLLVSAAALAACGSQEPKSGEPGSASPAPTSFVGMWENRGGQALIVEKTASGYVGTFYDGGVKEMQSGLRQSGVALIGVGKPADRWKIAYDTAKGRLVLSGPWAAMSFTKAPPDAQGQSGSSTQEDPFAGTWRGLGSPDDHGDIVVIARSGEGYRVSTLVGGGLFGTYTFARKGDLIQGVPPGTPKPKDTIRWVFRFEGRPGQLVMEYGNGLPHYVVRTSMSTSLPTSSPSL